MVTSNGSSPPPPPPELPYFVDINFVFSVSLGLITYDEFEILNSESRLKEMRNYLEKIHETNSNKRTRDSSTAFLDAYEHIDFRPLFESLRDRYEFDVKLVEKLKGQ